MEKNIQKTKINELLNKNKTHQKQNHQGCCSQNQQLCNFQYDHLIELLRHRYISPYKMIYMINQQEADLFKIRNQNSGCCSSSTITIPKHQMTKTQLYLSQSINECLKIGNINKILEQMSDKFDNIVKSGEKQNLKVDQQVEKFLVQKVVSQALTSQIYKMTLNKLKNQNQSISSSALLWATPNTWNSRYPNTPLNFLSAKLFTNLNDSNKCFGLQNDFLADYKDNLLYELKMLQKQGKFQQLIWNKNFQHIRNDLKVMNFPENYAFDGSEQNYIKGQIAYPNLKKSLLTLRSIPFELNQKQNSYCTISQNNQISYFKKSLNYKVKVNNKCRYLTFCFIGGDVEYTIFFNKDQKQLVQAKLNEGQLLIIDNELYNVQFKGKIDELFLFKSWIFTLKKKQ